ncbi:MAG: enoyl-CoA hydratase-related protein [Bacillota bacterium]
MSGSLLFEERGPVGLVTLNRPERRNALDLPTLTALDGLLQQVAGRRDLRALVITGAGEKAFCAGADLKEREGMTEAQVRTFLTTIRTAFRRLELLPLAVVGAANGLALGGGLELLLACDLRLAARDAVFGLPETALAIIPGAGGTQRLPRLVGLGRALEWILTGRTVTAEEALAAGLLTRVTEPTDLLPAALETAEAIAANGPVAVTQAKRAVRGGFELPLQEGLALEGEAYEAVLPTADRREALAAFREKRRPQYRGE